MTTSYGAIAGRAFNLALLSAALSSCAQPPAATRVAEGAHTAVLAPALATDAVPHDPDDPAIWISAGDPSRSLILATDKFDVDGGLYVFGLDGRLRQSIAPLDRPNNVDVEYGFALGDRQMDIAVLTERMKHRLRVFGIPSDGGPLVDLAPAGLPVLEGETGQASEPMGVALYKRPSDGVVFAIVAPKTGGGADYLWQYRLGNDSGGSITATLVRRFGTFSGVSADPEIGGEIEAVVVDDELGYVYFSDERFGIRKWRADPDAADRAIELGAFGRDGYQGDREGLAIYPRPDGTGYIVSSDQVPGGTRLHVFAREGSGGDRHAHPTLAVIPTTSDNTDGLELTMRPLPGFPRGAVIMMNSTPRNFDVYGWDAVAAAIARR